MKEDNISEEGEDSSEDDYSYDDDFEVIHSSLVLFKSYHSESYTHYTFNNGPFHPQQQIIQSTRNHQLTINQLTHTNIM